MKCKEIIKYLEEWAPKGIAWDRDNVGLQIGNPEREVKNVMLSLDLTGKVVSEAIRKKCNLIITHHPLLFHSIKRIDTNSNRTSKLVEMLIKNNITLYSAHTNLDFTKAGVSFQLAKKLKLNNIRFLKNLSGNQIKLSVFVPDSHIDNVADAIHNAGGGIIGEYSNCSFRTSGTGTFKGSESSNPAIGKKGKLETVEEKKLEVLADEWKLPQIIAGMKKAHPYEEVAYDLFVLKNENVNYGMGAIGELDEPMTKNAFLELVAKALNVSTLRHSNVIKNKIRKVAVCGGSGSELLAESIKQNADAFVTADIKYHTFHDAEEKIFLIDAGHNETELPVLDEVQKRLKEFLKNKNIKILKFTGSTNPVVFYNK
jgi:dinuclear metal center YbgI/SA1388 family protein